MDYKSNKNMLIGIEGKIKSGKSTSAELLKKSFPFLEYAMADPIKEIGTILGFEKEELYGTQAQKLQKNKHWGISAREFLQVFGTDVCREFLPTKIPSMNKIWVRRFEIFCQKHRGSNILVSDVRFGDEAEAIKKLGGIIVEIQRPDTEWEDIGENQEYDPHTHQSETESNSIKPDYLVINDSDLDALKEKLIRVVIEHYLV